MNAEPGLALASCLLRPLRPADARSIARHANDRGVWLGLRDRFPHPYALADAESYIELSASFPPGTHFAIVVEGEAAGTVGVVVGSDVHRRTAEIGYWLGRAFWGRGIMTEVVGRTTAHAIACFDLCRVYAHVFETNPSSARVLTKCGYAYEGRHRRAVVKDGRVLDELVYAFVV